MGKEAKRSLDRKIRVMNHSVLSYIFAAMSLVGIPGCKGKAVSSDFQWLLRKQPEIAQLSGEALVVHKSSTRNTTESRLQALRSKTLVSLAWVGSAAALGLLFFVLPAVPSGRLSQPQWLAITSVVAFSWATLGRLGWENQSNKGETIYEELDASIFWILYWLGAICGVGAVAPVAV